jgi:predicted nucleic acid-binding protein
MKVIADTNIIISSLISRKGKESDIIMNPLYDFEKYSCFFLLDEILKHKSKIQKASGLTDTEFLDVYFNITKKITFIDEEQIPDSIWHKAFFYTSGIDENDTPFVALTLYLKGYFWTGDKKLIRGITERGFKNILTTADIIAPSF